MELIQQQVDHPAGVMNSRKIRSGKIHFSPLRSSGLRAISLPFTITASGAQNPCPESAALPALGPSVRLGYIIRRLWAV